ncbi:MAG: tetratricopeptide repeat protein [Zoogloeaceae bacterium]|nr:tetratricopeptide repeat protein [Zoogloeaceae bacterium]
MSNLLIRFLCLLLVAVSGYFGWQIWALESRRIAVSAVPHAVSPQAVVADAALEAAAHPAPSLPGKAKAEPSRATPERRPMETSAPEDIVLRVHHARASETPTAVQQARAALAQGDLARAEAQFSALLAVEPHHLEALLGLAEIALRQDRGAAAWQFYQAALNAYPQDIRARTGILALAAASGQADASAVEGRLKNLMAEAPQAATPHFALGNLLAAQGRWREAQNAYFEACRRDRTNPDFRYNLAVSLDVLSQPRLAAEQYREALAAAAAGAPTNFAVPAVEARLLVLQALPEGGAP